MKHSSYKNIFGFVAFFLKDIPKISKAYHLIMEREKEIPLPYFVLSKNCDGVVTLSFLSVGWLQKKDWSSWFCLMCVCM